MAQGTWASAGTATGPLAGVKVLDLSIALTGPYAVALLADQGADVIKVERPGIGDIARWVGVAVNGMSAFYLACNRGKRCIAVDLGTDEGRDIVVELARQSDVVVQNFRPGVIDRLGLGYEAVRAINPDVVYCSISGYGSVGPYRDRSAYDTSIQAYAGFAANQAEPDGPPQFLHQNAADGSMPSSFNAGFQPMRFADGWGIVVPTTDADFAGMCRSLDVEGYDDPRIATVGERRKHRDVLEPVMDMCYAMAANLTQEEAIARFERERVPFAMVLSAAEIVDDPHAVAIGMFTELDHPVVGPARLPRHPSIFNGTPAALGGPSPALGEHTDEVLAELGLGERVDALRAAGVVA
jgi:crotonobetainyl-CoA:carnitine CoA-transferase CaiB-like acyl-CoA transferase